jgi:hypothetical protein
MVKFSRTLFIMYFSGRCFSFRMKLIMYSHIGDRCSLYRNRPPSNLQKWGTMYDLAGWGRKGKVLSKDMGNCSIPSMLLEYSDGSLSLGVAAFPYLYRNRAEICQSLFSVHCVYLAYSVSTFSTTCLPKLQTLVEHWIVMFSELSYLGRQ